MYCLEHKKVMDSLVSLSTWPEDSEAMEHF